MKGLSPVWASFFTDTIERCSKRIGTKSLSTVDRLDFSFWSFFSWIRFWLLGGSRIRTYSFQIMSLTSCQLLYPASLHVNFFVLKSHCDCVSFFKKDSTTHLLVPWLERETTKSLHLKRKTEFFSFQKEKEVFLVSFFNKLDEVEFRIFYFPSSLKKEKASFWNSKKVFFWFFCIFRIKTLFFLF